MGGHVLGAYGTPYSASINWMIGVIPRSGFDALTQDCFAFRSSNASRVYPAASLLCL
jgi:hypothetical protein